MCSNAETTMAYLGVTEEVINTTNDFNRAKARQDALNFKADVAVSNVGLAAVEIADVNRRKRVEQNRINRERNALVGSKRAKKSGGDLDINFGSPVEDLMDVEVFAAADKGTVAMNAEREKIAINVKRNSSISNSRLLENAADNESPEGIATTSLISGASRVATKHFENKLAFSKGKA